MSFQTKKVILVEDNQADLELTRLAYGSLAPDVDLVHCHDGQALIQLLPTIDLNEICYILLDLNMPRVSGLEVLKIFQAHREWGKIPVIVFTSSLHNQDVLQCYELRANAYVLKPLDFDVFDRTIRAIHEFWCNVNVTPDYYGYESEAEN